MERLGFAEFTRAFAAEARRGALVLDLRGNGGGHVSELLLARLAQRQMGFELPRWGAPEAYPSAARAGPLVLLLDEGTASDGEVAAWAFRASRLGPLVGTRTWGGVVGNDQYADLVDGSQLAIPQVSIVLGTGDEAASASGNAIENHGVEPDITVHIAPQDYAAGRDPQLQAAVLEALRLLAEQPAMALPRAAQERADAAAALSLAAAEPRDWPFEVWAPIADEDEEDEEDEESEEEDDAPLPRRRPGAARR